LLVRLAQGDPHVAHVWATRRMARRAMCALRRRVDALRATLAYEKIEGLRAEIIKETLKSLDL